MKQSLLARYPPRGVEGQHALQEVQRQRISSRVEVREGDARCIREGSDVLLCPRAADSPQSLFGRGAQVVKDLVQLVDVVPPFEDGLAAQELGENAADRPDVDCCCVILEGEPDARRGRAGQPVWQ